MEKELNNEERIIATTVAAAEIFAELNIDLVGEEESTAANSSNGSEASSGREKGSILQKIAVLFMPSLLMWVRLLLKRYFLMYKQYLLQKLERRTYVDHDRFLHQV